MVGQMTPRTIHDSGIVQEAKIGGWFRIHIRLEQIRRRFASRRKEQEKRPEFKLGVSRCHLGPEEPWLTSVDPTVPSDLSAFSKPPTKTLSSFRLNFARLDENNSCEMVEPKSVVTPRSWQVMAALVSELAADSAPPLYSQYANFILSLRWTGIN
jgi:hypothetical protein